MFTTGRNVFGVLIQTDGVLSERHLSVRKRNLLGIYAIKYEIPLCQSAAVVAE